MVSTDSNPSWHHRGDASGFLAPVTGLGADSMSRAGHTRFHPRFT